MIGKFELIVLLALVVTMLFVGGKKLPELARGVGQSAKELKKGFRDDDVADTQPAKNTTKK
jgi:sec-independent protein translocase protein TatA